LAAGFFAVAFSLVLPLVSLPLVLAFDLDLLSDLVLLAPFLPFSSFFAFVVLPVDADDLAVFLPADLVSFFFASFEAVSFFLDSAGFFAYFFSSAFF